MIIDKLLSDLLVHPRKRIVSSGQVSGKVGEGFLHEILDAKPLLLGDAGRKAETVDAAADSDPSGVDRGAGVNVPLDLGDIHVARVDRIRGDAVVLLNQRIKHIGKNLEYMLYHCISQYTNILRKVCTPQPHLVGVPISSIYSTMLIIELDGASDGLAKGEPTGGGLG